MKEILLLFALFFVAAIPRVWGLGRFITLDEYLWVDRSRNFLQALLNLDVTGTFQTGHPGVTTMWSGTLGLWLYSWRQGWLQSDQFVLFLNSLTWQNQPADLLPYMRSGLIFATAVAVLAIYLLTRRLAGASAALAATLLIALDPWLFGHSRILHHDALAAYAIIVAALALLNFLLVKPSIRMLLFSGATAGLAILTKDLALVVVLWAAGVFVLAFSFYHLPLSNLLRSFLMWSTAIVAAVFLLWPVMWLKPIDTLAKMLQLLSVYAQNPHEMGQFWFGGIVDDPGPAFYFLTLLYIASPPVMVGVITWIAGFWRRPQPDTPEYRSYLSGLMLVLFVGLYILLITLGAKKHIRYLLPALAGLNIVAGIGLSYAYNWLTNRPNPISIRWLPVTSAIALTGLLAAQLAPEFPYYFTYFNPFLGGRSSAAQVFSIGSGEGLDVAASYLNRSEDTSSLRVVSNLPNVFAPFFRGRTLDWSPDTVVFAADYVVIYRFQVQLGLPNQTYLDLITAHWPLEYTVSIGGLPYAWIYKAPAAEWIAGVDADPISATSGSLWSPPGLLAYKWRDHEGDLALTLYRFNDPCPPWQVRMRMNNAPWQAAAAIVLLATPNTVIREEDHMFARVDPSAATGRETEIGVVNSSCNRTQWWKLPTPVFKP